MSRVCRKRVVCYKAVVTELPERVEVAIIGGGFAGVATAWALRRRGVGDVLVVEREQELGRFASGRSAGLGRQLAEDDDTTALTVRGAQLLRELPHWTQAGSVMSFDDPALADVYVARAAKFGIAVEPLDRAGVLARWPQLAELRISRALGVPSDGVIAVQPLLRALAAEARIALGTRVTAVEAGLLTTSRGAIAARVIVDASGAWAGGLVGDEPLLAYKRHVFVLEAPATVQAPWLWHLGSGEIYLRGDAAGVLVSPCDASRSEPGHQEPDLVGEEHLRKLLDDTAPELAASRITRRWACQRAFAPDRKMRLGRDRDRPWLVWAAGLGGHGATASPAVGERVAEAVVAALA
ncbi:MAG TPA: FAD-dependent oxidoreductase [Kofleriaceae bacterium]|jgi:glycine/D-amino acid oxidase-like deaminating enzyme